ncbi:conserved hypothetical protein [Hyella patelloides LEGE 07179]|uniref:Uncharacterized protein n=1 Tax=Hyella patelloides LEGE 07179 TaxID=945734 RepID=A0A563VP00_9CYAN|nr:conserved hypothetical protein [Hyella patelloides LEGE 07179]
MLLDFQGMNDLEAWLSQENA